mmetsp:Transcript_8069/g.25913  ORF Transcript_8069/g.25913 Transcript_8069/m.25913 type:complete len:82 (+) Transcript_8069:974-1219(+)
MGSRPLWQPLVDEADARCAAAGLERVSSLDARARFERGVHLDAAHASALTFTLSAADFAVRAAAADWAPVGFVGNSLGGGN